MRSLAALVVPAIRWDPERGFAPAQPAIESALALGVGGFIVFGGERAALRSLTDRLHAASSEPLLIAADLERGAGQQVRGLTAFPPPLALASLGAEAVREAARITAREAADVGLTWALAPVLDLDVEPANPIVQSRSFGAAPSEVARLGATWIRECQAEGVLSCAKHFPGHGRTSADSHLELPLVGADRGQLEADLAPFRRAVEEGVASVMTAHVSYPALDASGAPATFSRAIVTDLLRGELGFRGLVVTDALIMEGARRVGGAGQAAVAALGAGCDLLLYPEQPDAVVEALEDAVRRGELAAARVDAALERGAAAAGVREGLDGRGPGGRGEGGRARRPLTAEELAAHGAWALAQAARAVRPVRGAIPALGPRRLVVEVVDDDAGAPFPLPPRTAFAEAWREAGGEVSAGGERVVLLFAEAKGGKGRAHLSPSSRAQLAARLERPAPVVVFGHPRLEAEIPGGGPVLVAFGGDPLMQRAAATRLLGG